ncbi:MAG: BstXI family restriction endonuclease [Bacteroidales bacterium]|nr:BstXI family restriction endonuclease [Bacteroidales bacterium]
MFNLSKKNYSQVYNTLSKYLPYKIKKKLNKTAEGRSGLEIYKRRNNRGIRVLMQYITWDKMKTGVIPNILSQYQSGYIVMISPRDYFGNNYPNPSPDLNPDFILGETGFVYYSSISELRDYPVLASWNQLIELDTQSTQSEPNWKGEYATNVKNANPPEISFICSNPKSTADKAAKVRQVRAHVQTTYPTVTNEILDSLPKQCGIGNYDYDYASPEMQAMVKLQMAHLLLSCTAEDGSDFATYVVNNLDDILCKDDTASFRTLLNAPDQYINNFRVLMDEFTTYCAAHDLLDYNQLSNISATNSAHKTVCPLCCKPLYTNYFFEEILQEEGRQVFDNTQREMVLMHINALKPGLLNHKTYNLGWGHNFCNLIQGDKSLDDTIVELRNILDSHDNP